ncbi:hypothetical protein FCV25MIE_09412 [Fagus crenata]
MTQQNATNLQEMTWQNQQLIKALRKEIRTPSQVIHNDNQNNHESEGSHRQLPLNHDTEGSQWQPSTNHEAEEADGFLLETLKVIEVANDPLTTEKGKKA